MRILVFGDSIAHGFYDTSGGWVARLKSNENNRKLKIAGTNRDFLIFANVSVTIFLKNYGSSTASITWTTPFDASTSAD